MIKLLHNRKCVKCPLKTFITRLLGIGILVISLSSYAVPSARVCSRGWSLTNITSGMSFGDFAVETGSGTITLNGGSSRAAGGTVDLVSAGSAVNSHQISLTNTSDVACAIYGIQLSWRRDPASRPMTGAGNDIPVSNVLVYVPGQAGSPFTLSTPTLYLDPASLPVTIEITGQMDTASVQLGGAYRSRTYQITLRQGGAGRGRLRVSGRSNAFAVTPLTITPGVSMDFGQISPGTAGGTIILNAISGARTVGSGDADVVGDAIAGTPATFTIQGDVGLNFNVSYINGLLTDSAGGNPITISGFTDNTAGLTLTGGADTFSVGATLTLTGSQPAGNYSTVNPGGSPYTITVNYN